MPVKKRILLSQDDSPSRLSFQQLSEDDLRARRLRAQCLAPRLPRQSLVQAVQTVCGINAQLSSAMALSLRARVQGLTLADIETRRVQDRTIVQIWCMRGTIHLVPTDDVDAFLSAISPAVLRAGWHWLAQRAGLEPERAKRVLATASRALKEHGPMTRRELMDVVVERHGQGVKAAAAGVVRLGSLLGRVCFGPDQGAEPTYVAMDNWLGREVKIKTPDHVELARRYLAGYGPATERDLAAWWGMGLTEAKAAWKQLREELVELEVDGRSAWMLNSESKGLGKSVPPNQTVRLLPAFDTYLLGYHHRDAAVPPEYRSRIFHGGEIVPTILVDGRAAGTWHHERRGSRVEIQATPFTSFSSQIRDLIEEEAKDIGRFWDLTPALHFGKKGLSGLTF